nr:hypothetical protein [uncultured Undibacterium sp.]
MATNKEKPSIPTVAPSRGMAQDHANVNRTPTYKKPPPPPSPPTKK